MLTARPRARTRRRSQPERPASASRPATSPSRWGKRSSPFYLLISLLVVLCLTGVVMVLSASSVLAIQQYGSPWHFFERQVLWMVVGTGVFVVGLRVDRRRLRRVARPAMVVVTGLLLAVLVPHVGDSAGGAARWLGTSSLSIQPSELAKLALILFAADVLDRRDVGRSGRGWRYEMGPVLAVFAIVAMLVLAQPDMGTTLVLGLITLAVLFTAGIPAGPLAGLVGLAGVGSLGLAVVAPYRWRRLTSFTHPLQQATNAGYQAVQGNIALVHGGIGGDGIGASIASYGFLPNAQTDFIFAIIGEETGLIGTLALSGLFLAVGLVGVRIACGARDRFSGLLAAGITAWLVGQALINIGAVVGLLPVTGVPLPFVSYGGSSLVIELLAAGILGNVALNP
jgi:cell division protein FtsW